MEPAEEIRRLLEQLEEYEQKLEKCVDTEQFLQIIISGIADTFFITDTNGNFIYIHPNAHHLLKCTEQEIQSRGTIWEVFGTFTYDYIKLDKDGELRNIEHDITDGDGHKRTLLITLKKVYLKQDALLFTCRDITERKRMEEVLYASEQRFRSIANNLPGVVTQLYIENEEISIDYISDGALDFFGYPPIDLMVNPTLYLDIVKPAYRDKLLSKLLDASQSLVPFTLEYEIQKKGDTAKWVTTSISPHPQNDGSSSVVAITLDITTVKRLEREVQEATLREQRRLGQELHDGIAQQIGGITFLSQVLEGKLRKKDFSERLEAEKITSYLNDLLEQTRQLASGLYPGIIEREGLITALEELALKTISMYGVNCSFVPRITVPIDVVSIAVHVYRITQEAVNNAVTHGKSTRIIITLVQEKDWYALTITDNGVGFDTGARSKGGMGLTTMRNRALLIGGELRIENTVPSGTTVSCTFHL